MGHTGHLHYQSQGELAGWLPGLVASCHLHAYLLPTSLGEALLNDKHVCLMSSGRAGPTLHQIDPLLESPALGQSQGEQA